jgi:L-asparaginase / beta-aspartyl-peptidase
MKKISLRHKPYAICGNQMFSVFTNLMYASLVVFALAAALTSCGPTVENSDQKSSNQKSQVKAQDWALVIHGGAGHFDEESYTKEEEEAYRSNLQAALDAGIAVLAQGGSSMDAVEAVIVTLEDCPLFNAGKGAVFTSEGINEMDASFMDGQTINCGAVTGIQNVKNPIKAARLVMDSSPHVFFSGAGATQFARENGLVMVDSSYFRTEKSWDRYLKAKAKHDSPSAALPSSYKFGTVGCVALDKQGNLAAGTSTGGMTWKENGRIGDSPVIAAGTYADNNSCAISCTGHGEYFIRAAVAHDIAARKEYKDIPLQQAAEEVVMKKLVDMGGEGGVIGVDNLGNVVMCYNSTGMFRAYATASGDSEIAMYGPYQSALN